MFFPYRFDPQFRAIWKLAGARPDVDGVTVDDGRFVATYGRKLTVDVPLDHIAEVHVTHDYRWWKAVGTRLSFADSGLTFGTSTHGGVCVHFRNPIPRLIGFRRHDALTVTVDDLDGLEAAVQAAIDARITKAAEAADDSAPTEDGPPPRRGSRLRRPPT